MLRRRKRSDLYCHNLLFQFYVRFSTLYDDFDDFDVTIESDQIYMRVLRVLYFIPLHQAVKIKSHQIIPVPGGASPPRTPPNIYYGI